MDKQVKRFIETHKDLINKEDWKTFYENACKEFEQGSPHRVIHIGQITDLLFKADIDPLEKLTTVPPYYLAGQKLDNNTFIVPSWCIEIGRGAFDATNLESINLPNEVEVLGDGAFNSCMSLQSITLPSNMIKLGNRCFNRCISLTSIIIPDKVKVLGEGCFSGCKDLANVTLGNGVTTIRAYAFNYMDSLQTITIPSSVQVIEVDAFYHNKALKELIYKGTVEQWNTITQLRNVCRDTPCTIKCLDGELHPFNP